MKKNTVLSFAIAGAIALSPVPVHGMETIKSIPEYTRRFTDWAQQNLTPAQAQAQLMQSIDRLKNCILNRQCSRSDALKITGGIVALIGVMFVIQKKLIDRIKVGTRRWNKKGELATVTEVSKNYIKYTHTFGSVQADGTTDRELFKSLYPYRFDPTKQRK